MTLLTRLFGLIPLSIGALLGYGIYLFVLNTYILLNWVSECIDAPESLAIILTVLIIIVLLNMFIIAIGLAVHLILIGLSIIINRNY